MSATILRTSNGHLDAVDRAKLDLLKQRLSNGNRKVLLYLHGGLVDETAAKEMADRLSGTGDTALKIGQDWEQVYVLWRTGVTETLKVNWTDIFENDRLYRALLKRLISFISRKLTVVDGNARGPASHAMSDDDIDQRLELRRGKPFAKLEKLVGEEERAGLARVSVKELEELNHEIQLDKKLIKIANDIEADLGKDYKTKSRSSFAGDPVEGAKTVSRVSDNIEAEWKSSATDTGGRFVGTGAVLWSIANHGVAIGLRVVNRFRSERDHGIHATIAEEIAREFYGDLIGSTIWYMMVKDAADHFLEERLGGELLHLFAQYQDLNLVIVGHSAGSIWATEFLMERSKLKSQSKVGLVLLAPAVRTLKFASMLDQARDSIGLFRMFAMNDKLEKADALLGSELSYIYPSSLLYLVSGAFEHAHGEAYTDAPLLGMERFIGGERDWLAEQDEFDALKKVRTFLSEKPDRVILSESQLGKGLNTASTSHGGFDDDPETLVSIVDYIS